MERDHRPPFEGAASFHTTHWTVVLRAAQGEEPGGKPLCLICAGSIGIHSTPSLGAVGIRPMMPRT